MAFLATARSSAWRTLWDWTPTLQSAVLSFLCASPFCWDSPCVYFGASLEVLILIVRANIFSSKRTKVAISFAGMAMNYTAAGYTHSGSATFLSGIMFPELCPPQTSQFTLKNNATGKCEGISFLENRAELWDLKSPENKRLGTYALVRM